MEKKICIKAVIFAVATALSAAVPAFAITGGTSDTSYVTQQNAQTSDLASGAGSSATGYNATAIGAGSVASQSTQQTSANDPALTGETGKTITGGYASSSTAVGAESAATAEGATATGSQSTASGDGSSATGYDADASGYHSSSTGAFSSATGDFSTANGASAAASGLASTADGENSAASGSVSVAVGSYADASGAGSDANGTSATASGAYSTADGSAAQASGDYSSATGMSATASGAYSTADGSASRAAGTGSTAIGTYAYVSASGKNSVALGNDSVATGANTVSVGNSTMQRQITNMAAGAVNSESTDAVNGSQLYSTNQSVAQYLGGGARVGENGAIYAPSYTVGGAQYNNVGSAIGALNARISSVKNDAQTMADKVGSIDASMATAAAEAAAGQHRNTISGGTADYNGQSSFAFAYQHRFNSNWAGMVSVASNGQGDNTVVSAGGSYSW